MPFCAPPGPARAQASGGAGGSGRMSPGRRCSRGRASGRRTGGGWCFSSGTSAAARANLRSGAHRRTRHPFGCSIPPLAAPARRRASSSCCGPRLACPRPARCSSAPAALSWLRRSASAPGTRYRAGEEASSPFTRRGRVPSSAATPLGRGAVRPDPGQAGSLTRQSHGRIAPAAGCWSYSPATVSTTSPS